MRCNAEKTLNFASLVVGMVAAAILCLAVASDYWLFTSEPYDVTASLQQSAGGAGGAAVFEAGVPGSPATPILSMISTHSGLWQLCVQSLDSGTASLPSSELVNEEKDSPDLSMQPCSVISYIGQNIERVDGGDTAISIVRSMRKATPVILISVLLVLCAETFSVIGYKCNDLRTLIGAILFILSALNLALGLILYISAVNDEVAQWKKPENASEGQIFSYEYGWSFYAAGSAFVLAMASAVGQISLYLGRFSGDVKDMIVIVPGLKTGAADRTSNGAGVEDQEAEAFVPVPGVVVGPSPVRLDFEENHNGGVGRHQNYSSVIY